MFGWLKGKIDKATKKVTGKVKHNHYKKDVTGYDVIDVYDVCNIFEVEDNSGCTHHIIKKLLVMGKRGHKSKARDLQDIKDSVDRLCEIYKDDK